jgi:hypothetical protein
MYGTVAPEIRAAYSLGYYIIRCRFNKNLLTLRPYAYLAIRLKHTDAMYSWPSFFLLARGGLRAFAPHVRTAYCSLYHASALLEACIAALHAFYLDVHYRYYDPSTLAP